MGPDGDGRGVVVRVAARDLIGAYRPAVMLVLLDVALDADWHDGRLVAPTSARLVAEHLGLDPGTAASALRVLRDAGLVELEQATEAGGRFGLAAYAVRLPDGIETVVASPIASCTEKPHTENPDTADAHAGLVLSCPWDGRPEPAPGRAHSGVIGSAAPPAGPWSPPAPGSLPASPPRPRPSRRPRRPARRAEQGAFDLGDGA